MTKWDRIVLRIIGLMLLGNGIIYMLLLLYSASLMSPCGGLFCFLLLTGFAGALLFVMSFKVPK